MLASFLSVKEVANLLSINEETVRRWIRDGKLEAEDRGGRIGYRISEDNLKNCVRQEKGLFALFTDGLMSALDISKVLTMSANFSDSSYTSSATKSNLSLQQDMEVADFPKDDVELIKRELELQKKKTYLKLELARIESEIEFIDHEIEALNKLRDINK